MEIKWGLQNNNNNNNNNNMIRLVPARIESRRVRFSRKSNEDEFPRKSNGGWIFLGIKWGLQKKIKNNIQIKLSYIKMDILSFYLLKLNSLSCILIN